MTDERKTHEPPREGGRDPLVDEPRVGEPRVDDPREDNRAREAVENPLGAAKPKPNEPMPSPRNWVIPAVIAVIAVIIILFLAL